MNIIIMLLLISLLILVHELGHYLAAVAFGVKVEKFGFGLPIGPTLFRTKWGETEILVHAFLLGGYVSFPDDEDSCLEKDSQGESALAANEAKADILPVDSSRRFKNKAPWQKAIIVSAGVIANIIFAIFLVYFTAAVWGKLPSGQYDVYIKEMINPEKSSAAQKGITLNDKIVEVNGHKIDNAYQLIFLIKKSKLHDGLVTTHAVEKNLEQLKKLNPQFDENSIIKKGERIKLPVLSKEEPLNVSRDVLIGMSKYKTDELNLDEKQIKIRDEIKGNIYTTSMPIMLEDAAYAISDTYKPLTIKVERDGKILTFDDIKADKEGMLGVKLEAKEKFIRTKSPAQVVKYGSAYLWDNTYLMLYGLWQLVSGKVPIEDLHGIVAITKIGGDIIENKGIFNGLLLTAIISIDLAIINLLPIPALDGGHLLFLLIEKLRGRPLREEVVENFARVGFIFLIALMIFVIFNDIFGLATKKF